MLLLLIAWPFFPFIWIYRHLTAKPISKRFLLIQTAKIGDVICATPIIKAIKEQHPDAFLAVLVHPSTAPLLRHCKEIDEILLTPPNGYRGIKAKWIFFLTLYSRRFDCSIGLNCSLPLWLLPGLAAISCHAAILPPQMSSTLWLALPWLTHKIRHSPKQLQLQTVTKLLNMLGIPVVHYKKYLCSAPSAYLKVNELLQSATGSIVGISIAAKSPMKEVDEKTLLHLMGLLLEDTCHMVLIGGPGDREKAHRLIHDPKIAFYAEKSHKIIDAVGHFQLDELVCLMGALDVFIGFDSGTSFCAEAAETPMVISIGASNFMEQRPLGRNTIFLTPVGLSCAPCSSLHCIVEGCHNRHQPMACIKQITAQRIYAATRSLLT